MPRMSNPLHSALEALGWSPAYLARYLGIGDRNVRRALRGDFPLPEAAMDWLGYLTQPVGGHPPSLEMIADRMAAQPLPDGWGTGDLPLTPRPRAAHTAAETPDASA
jgi:hypothetical protein